MSRIFLYIYVGSIFMKKEIPTQLCLLFFFDFLMLTLSVVNKNVLESFFKNNLLWVLPKLGQLAQGPTKFNRFFLFFPYIYLATLSASEALIGGWFKEMYSCSGQYVMWFLDCSMAELGHRNKKWKFSFSPPLKGL